MNKWIASVFVSAFVLLADMANFMSRVHTRARYVKEEDYDKKSPGFVLLGMHRSGTSLLTGLLNLGYGYNVGGNLIDAQEDNPRGFFERNDVIDQNDHWLHAQSLYWASEDLMNFNIEKALSDQDPIAVIEAMHLDITQERSTNYEEQVQGIRTLEFLTNEKNMPWILKEPRLCITLPVWIDQLKRGFAVNHHNSFKLPAVLFTYRHPIEVAESLVQRNKFTMEKGFLLWLTYNQKAIQNSADLCRVITNNDDIMKDPAKELSRISNELTENCGVSPPPLAFNDALLDDFFDEGLQHTHLGFDFEKECIKKEFQEAEEMHRNEAYFKEVIQVYCDMKRGRAFEADYQFPAARYFYE